MSGAANPQAVRTRATEKMEAALDHLRKELAGVRTGRASTGLLDQIKVNYYGNPTPLKQVASLSIPESRQIMIQPWEPGLIPEIEKAIQASDLGLTPANDGKLIRLSFPPLTEERRKDLVKLSRKLAEDARVATRNVRRDANDELKALAKEGKISEDESKRFQDETQKLTDQYIRKIDDVIKNKEAEILEK